MSGFRHNACQFWLKVVGVLEIWPKWAFATYFGTLYVTLTYDFLTPKVDN